MKKIFLFIFSLSLVIMTHAQSTTFKPFRTDFSIGLAIPKGESDAKGGYIAALEPRYALNDAFSLGLKVEVAITDNFDYLEDDNETYSVKARLMLQLTGDYYLSSNRLRPFIGAGIGLMRIAGGTKLAEDSADLEQSDLQYGTRFATTPRLGIEFGHVRLATAYTVTSGQGGYFAVKLGVLFGGGRRD